MVDSLVVQQVGGDDLVDDLLAELGTDDLVGDVLIVLGGDDDGVDTLGGEEAAVLGVLDGDLGLGIGTEPREGAVLAELGELQHQLGGKDVGQRHVLWGFVGSISEHVSLITSSQILKATVNVDSLCNVWALLLNGDKHVASLVVEAFKYIECIVQSPSVPTLRRRKKVTMGEKKNIHI